MWRNIIIRHKIGTLYYMEHHVDTYSHKYIAAIERINGDGRKDACGCCDSHSVIVHNT